MVRNIRKNQHMRGTTIIAVIILAGLAGACTREQRGQGAESDKAPGLQATAAEAEVETLKQQAAQLQVENRQLQQELQQEKLKTLAARKDSLGGELTELDSALVLLAADSAAAIQARDSLRQKMAFAAQLGKEIQERLIANSRALEKELAALEDKKRSVQQGMEMDVKRVEVAEKKIAVLQEEKALNENQRRKLWVDGAPQSAIDEAAQAVIATDEAIAAEQNKIKAANRTLAGIQETLDGIDKQRGGLNEKIRNNYTAKEVLDEVAASEAAALTLALARLDSLQQAHQQKRQGLQQDKEKARAYLAGLEQQQATLDSAAASVFPDSVQLQASAAADTIAAPYITQVQTDSTQTSWPLAELRKNRQLYFNTLAVFTLALLLLYFLFRLFRKRKRQAG